MNILEMYDIYLLRRCCEIFMHDNFFEDFWRRDVYFLNK